MHPDFSGQVSSSAGRVGTTRFQSTWREPARVAEILLARVPWISARLPVSVVLSANSGHDFDQMILELFSFLLGMAEGIASELQIEGEPDQQVVLRSGFRS
jgi:hypothetical protein